MDLRERFSVVYPKEAEVRLSFCPYRICPLGAHVDHQHGKVTGFALDRGITIAYAPTDSGAVELHSLNFSGKTEFHIASVPERQGDWADYLRGAVLSLARLAPLRRGVRALIEGSLPIGGLSSSAAVVIAFLSALCGANDVRLSGQQLIAAALWSENHYSGVNVGKLDQSCEVLGKKDHLLYLDTRDDSFELIPAHPSMRPWEIGVFFSGIERVLAGSAYNSRVDELKSAAYALKAYAGLPYDRFADARLRDVPRELFDRYGERLPESFRKRAEHYYSECERVERGVEAWRKGDIVTFGRLSFQSGHSSIHSYETGSEQLRRLYEIMLRTEGIYGGRFSGAGFNGCCMALVDPGYREAVRESVTREYVKAYPQLADRFSVHFCRTADGCACREGG